MLKFTLFVSLAVPIFIFIYLVCLVDLYCFYSLFQYLHILLEGKSSFILSCLLFDRFFCATLLMGLAYPQAIIFYVVIVCLDLYCRVNSHSFLVTFQWIIKIIMAIQKYISSYQYYILDKLINMSFLPTLTTHTLPQQWKGQRPNRFKGGRFHNNHPTDQLDNLLIGTSSTQQKCLGPSKRRIEPQSVIRDRLNGPYLEQVKPHIRTFEGHNSSNIVFSAEYIPRLIKIAPNNSDQYNMNSSILFRGKHIGESKLKNLQTGGLKTGIYRNFYKSMAKTQSLQLF